MDTVSMKPQHYVVLLVMLLSSLVVLSQTEPGPKRTVDSNTVEEFKGGIVVEEVEKNSEAEKAGVRKDDIILRWARGDARGQIESPFDLSSIEVEQAPRGPVTLGGLRGTARQIWTLGPNSWGFKVRPDLPPTFLFAYREGEALAAAGKLVEAAEHWRALADEISKSNSSELPAWLLLHLASSLSDRKLIKDADQVYQEAVARARQSRPGIVAEMFRLWGKYLQSVVESRKSGHQTLTEAWDLNILGNLAADSGDSHKALAYYEESLAIRDSLAPDSLPVAGSLANLGLLYWRLGDLAKAEQHSRRGLTIGLKLAPASVAVAANLNNLGMVSWQSGDLQSADVYYRKAIDVQKQVNPNGNLTPYLMNLGIVASDRDDFAKAEQYFSQVLKLREQSNPGGVGVAAILENLADLFRRRHDLARAEEYLLRALAILRTPAHEGALEATVLGELGGILRERGDLIAAETYQRRALSIARQVAPDGSLTAGILNGLAELAATGNDLRMAEDYYKQAIDLRSEELTPNSPTRVESLAGLASVMRHKGHWSEAAQLLEQALSALEYQTVHLGGTLRQRTDFRAKHASYYRDYIDILMEQKKPERAFSVLERSRAQSLLEMLARAHVDIRQGADPALLARDRSLRRLLATKLNRKLQPMKSDHTAEDLTAAMKDIQDIIEQYHELEEKLQVANPSYAALTRPQAVDEKQVQEHLLGDNTLLLEYSLGDEHSYVWAITKNSFAAYALPNRAEIERAARRVRDTLTARNYSKKGETDLQRLSRSNDADAQYPAAAAALSRMVLGPVVPLLGDKRLLLIVSDGILQYIPFAALPLRGDVQNHDPASWVPLIRDHEVVNLPSASVLAVLKRQTAGRARATKIVAVLADPVFDASDARVGAKKASGRAATSSNPTAKAEKVPASDLLSRSLLLRSASEMGLAQGDERFPRLFFSRFEADAILRGIPLGQRLEALGFKASRATATSQELYNYRIVHFATHGLLNSEHPELSGLVLSLVDEQGKEQNGFLGLEDIYNLNLRADLVVLSACETGLGKEIQGEGLVGIARGFMYAGASSVVASLWKVDDLATAELMKVFYKGMLNDNLRPAAALRRAQIAMSRRWPSPYYWAGFVLQGQP